MNNYNKHLRRNYKQLLNIISENLEGDDKIFVTENIDKLSNSFLKLSKIIRNLNDIVVNNDDYNLQLLKIKKKYKFTEQESKNC